ncbi:hypothetical protein OOZ51_21575 [Arthrobacter sp. MI7-26]|uniref:hypothetical protein n=1 Tax=Arthrobacter sp. MI7-26 TaxID=2993653 RepID=UPI002248FB75|nr:hypothetical protein [Arthrobacter sp. MI7-26]MCX2750375.1 hypothetical protein [Arthrobacter sp. MI7-26]
MDHEDTHHQIDSNRKNYVENHGSGSIEDTSIIDQSKARTFGENSHIAGRDIYITHASTENGKRTTVELRKRKLSWVTSTRAKFIALAATVVSAAMSVLTAVGPIDWHVWFSVKDVQTFELALRDTIVSGFPLVLATFVSFLLTVGSWKFCVARVRNWPVYRGKFSFRKALIPSKSVPGLFFRAYPFAECTDCVEDNRPGVYAKLFSRAKNSSGIVAYRCRNGHSESNFRGRSVFAP